MAGAYRTVSKDALDAFTGTMPIGLDVRKCKLTYLFRGAVSGQRPQDYIRQYTEISRAADRCCGIRAPTDEDIEKIFMIAWREAWNASTKGEWTRTPFPDIRVWLNRKHGELSYHMTQALTGHGCFPS